MTSKETGMFVVVLPSKLPETEAGTVRVCGAAEGAESQCVIWVEEMTVDELHRRLFTPAARPIG